MAITRDSFTGSCTELADHIRNHGVKDAGGNHHPGWPGFTHAEPEVQWDAPKKIGVDQKTRFYCSVKDQYFDTIAECQARCPTRLGTIPCVPRDGVFRVPITAKPLFRASPVSTRLHWESGFKTDEACKNEIARWYADIEKHEAAHVKAINDMVAKRNSGARRMTFDGYGDTEETAEANAKAKMAKYVDEQTTDMVEQIRNEAKAFHDGPAGGPTPNPDCSKCG